MGCGSSLDKPSWQAAEAAANPRKGDYHMCRPRQDQDSDNSDSNDTDQTHADLSCTSTTAMRQDVVKSRSSPGISKTAPKAPIASMLLPAFGQSSFEECEHTAEDIGATQNDYGSTSSPVQPVLTLMGGCGGTAAGVSMTSLICMQAPPLFRSLLASLADATHRAAVYRVIKTAVMWDYDVLKDMEWSARGLPNLAMESLAVGDAPPLVADRLLTLRLLRQFVDEHHRVKSQQLLGMSVSKAMLDVSMTSPLSSVEVADGSPYNDVLEIPLREEVLVSSSE